MNNDVDIELWLDDENEQRFLGEPEISIVPRIGETINRVGFGVYTVKDVEHIINSKQHTIEIHIVKK